MHYSEPPINYPGHTYAMSERKGESNLDSEGRSNLESEGRSLLNLGKENQILRAKEAPQEQAASL